MPRTLHSSSDFNELLDQYDTWLFDCDGVIWDGPRGDELTPHIAKTLKFLKEDRRKRCVFVTNNATKSRWQYLQKFHNLGISTVTQDEIFTCGSASASYLKSELLPERQKKGLPCGVYVIGQAGLEEELMAEGLKWKGGTDPEDDVLMPHQDFSTITPDPTIGVVLFSFQMHLNYKQLSKAYNYLGTNPSCDLVLTNDDQTVLIPGGVCPGEGAMASVLYGARKGLKPIIVGKPNVALLDAVHRVFPYDPKRTIMVGDRLETDVLFGKAGGLATLLVLTGSSKLGDIDHVAEELRPDYVADCVGEILKVNEK